MLTIRFELMLASPLPVHDGRTYSLSRLHMSSGDNRIAKETGLALIFVAVVLVVPVVVLSVREFQRRSQQRRRDQSYCNTRVALPAAHGTYLRSGAEVLRIAVLDDSSHGREMPRLGASQSLRLEAPQGRLLDLLLSPLRGVADMSSSM
jgi:hypothetical protein